MIAIMTDFAYYIYYRITHAMIHFGWDDRFSFHAAAMDVICCLTFNLIFILLVLLYAFFDIQPLVAIKYCSIPCLIFIILIVDFSNEESLYKELEEKYKSEEYRMLKGCLTFMYCVFSIFSVVTLALII